jgi:hypothetical protein
MPNPLLGGYNHTQAVQKAKRLNGQAASLLSEVLDEHLPNNVRIYKLGKAVAAIAEQRDLLDIIEAIGGEAREERKRAS